MPRAFTTEERTRIVALLLAAGERQFAQRGMRRAQIDEITAEVGIAKGSFYSFFASKEELYLQVSEGVERRMRGEIDREMADADLPPCDLVLWFLRRQSRAILEEPFLRAAFTGDDLVWLRTRVSPERFAEHIDLDARYLSATLDGWRGRGIVLTVDDATAIELITRVYLPPLALGEVALIGDAVSDHGFRALAEYLTGIPCKGESDG